MKKYFLIAFALGLVSLPFVSPVIADRKFKKDLSVQNLPSSLRVGHFEQVDNLQWVPVYGKYEICSDWAGKNDWQELYSKGDVINRVLTTTERAMINGIRIDGILMDQSKISRIYNKSIDSTDIGYLVLFDSSSVDYCAVIIAFRT